MRTSIIILITIVLLGSCGKTEVKNFERPEWCSANPEASGCKQWEEMNNNILKSKDLDNTGQAHMHGPSILSSDSTAVLSFAKEKTSMANVPFGRLRFYENSTSNDYKLYSFINLFDAYLPYEDIVYGDHTGKEWHVSARRIYSTPIYDADSIQKDIMNFYVILKRCQRCKLNGDPY